MDLKKELEKFTIKFNHDLEIFLKNGSPKKLYDAARHLPLAGGKRLRPVISMLSCNAVGGDGNQVIPFAISLELLHNFTLVHDDIMDHSNLRRNTPTVHIKYGEPTAIIAGDLLFTKSFEAMHDLNIDLSNFKKLEYGLTQTIREICEGQQLDMEFEQRKKVNEKEYLEMIMKKTAVLFMFSAEGGAIAGGGSKGQVDALKSYGQNLGLAFQIRDDYLDMSSDEKTLGKDIGNDIRNGKKTLIAVHSMANATGRKKEILDNIFGNKRATEQDIKKIYEIFKELKSINYAKITSEKYSKNAKMALKNIGDSEAKQILLELADYSIKREK
jgi:geranylgeranyl diphosphate synthase type I